MAIEQVRAYFQTYGLEKKIIEFDVSSATVDLAHVHWVVSLNRLLKRFRFTTNEAVRC
ncbi:MAG: hypothetical protein LRY52_02675 [Sulfurospirillum cavolei]|nr:hypothetical protein [Sulfurospirillum cavolei]